MKPILRQQKIWFRGVQFSIGIGDKILPLLNWLLLKRSVLKQYLPNSQHKLLWIRQYEGYIEAVQNIVMYQTFFFTLDTYQCLKFNFKWWIWCLQFLKGCMIIVKGFVIIVKCEMRVTEGSRIYKVNKIWAEKFFFLCLPHFKSEKSLKKIHGGFLKKYFKIRVCHFSIVNGSEYNFFLYHILSINFF